MSRYALASHVFACLDNDYVVLLDLKQDRYFSFETHKAGGLDSLVSGWPVAVGAPVNNPGRVAEQLHEKGLLVRGNVAREVASLDVPAVREELICDQYEESPPRQFGHVIAFLRATVTATLMLRCRSLEQAVHRVKNRKVRLRRSDRLDAGRIRELVAIFTDLRPYLFSSRDQCLFESLVLIEFLARYGIFPNWVFGVQARPFAAHCWVQYGGTALNDTREHLARYTPIMAI